MNRRGFLKFVGLGAAAGVGVAALPAVVKPPQNYTHVREYTKDTFSEYMVDETHPQWAIVGEDGPEYFYGSSGLFYFTDQAKPVSLTRNGPQTKILT